VPTFTLVPTWTSRPTRTPTITPTPTYDYPDGRVLQQANCRYGPGAAYLFEWGLYPGDRVTIYNRNDDGSWLYVKPRSYQGRCWVSASLLEIHGDIFALDPFYGALPYSTLYPPPSNVYAAREGSDVWISWDAVWMTEDDYRGYLVEAWLCLDGEVVFTPVHVDGTVVILQDEPGCDERSHGRVFAVEKHGYTDPVTIIWPSHVPPSTPPVTRP
jgi:hypothetical protein